LTGNCSYRAFDVPDDDAAFERVATHVMPDGESRVWNNAIMELGGVACGKTLAVMRPVVRGASGVTRIQGGSPRL